ncbi:MAG: ABC transporter permease [Desulfovibrionaceae bacterium]|nr:ABC transporter permease [Desulfovibrionaceae bacterium]
MISQLRQKSVVAFRGFIGFVFFLCAWEATSRSPIGNLVLFPPPSSAIQVLFDMMSSGELTKHIVASGRRVLLGFLAGAFPAVLLGILTGHSSAWSSYLNPLLHTFRSIPPLALVPFGVFWFGIGETSKVALVAWAVFFPIWVNTDAGIHNISPLLTRAAACLGARGWRMLFLVHLPSALPYILTGLKVSLSVGIATLVAAELAGAIFGVGYLIQVSQQIFRVDVMLVGLIALGVGNCLLIAVLNWIIARLAPWYGAEQLSLKH